MSTAKIHNVRFYRPKPKAIYCMTLNKKLHKLALSRSDASIEIWNLKDSAFLEKRFPPYVKNNSIEGLAWSEDRLFSVGLHALLVEYNLKQLSIKQQTTVTGQTAFCLDVNPQNTHIAVGTEQGYLNLFSITDDELMFEKFLDKQEGRILCLKYDHTGEFIASGSMDTIRIWNVQTGHAIHKMTTGRINANKPTIVWCIAITKSFTIISGDSRGKLSFWDGKIGAQTESYQSHRADILSLCLSDDDNELHCAGIDANIICYQNIAVREDCHKWVKSTQRKVHDHDVRALIMHKTHLFSGGVDGYLALSYHPPKTLVKYPPISQQPENCVALASKARMVLLKYPKYLELWSVGVESDENVDNGNDMLPIKERPKKLLVLQRQVKTDLGVKREGMLCSAISDDGKYIAFSTMGVLRLFRFGYVKGEEIELVECDLPEEGPAVKMVFIGGRLVLAKQNGGLMIVVINEDVGVVVQEISTEKYINDTITFLTASTCGQYLLAADPESNIAIWKLVNKSWDFYYKLPKHSSSPTAITIYSSKSVLIAYADHKISEFNLTTCKLADFSSEVVDKNSKIFTKHFPIRNIIPCKDTVLLHDDSNIQIINKKKKAMLQSPKIAKLDAKEAKKKPDELLSIRTIKKYKHLINLGVLSDNELVAVEVSPLKLIEHLPPAFKQNIFGTK